MPRVRPSFDCSSPFCFLSIEFHCTFFISYKILTNYVYYYYCILIRIVKRRRDFFLWCQLYFFPLFLPSSFVSLSYVVLAVLMQECLGEHSFVSSTFPIATANGTLSPRGELVRALADA